jgi:hypothetical protein
VDRRLISATLVFALLLATACRSGAAIVTDLDLAFQFTPAVPIVGQDTMVDIVLRDASGPVRDARLTLEGHMSHPGMTPVVVSLAHNGDGRYHAAIALTMAGEWVLQINGQLADQRRVRQRVAAAVAVVAESP